MILRVKKLLMVLLAGVLALSMGIAIAMNMPTVKADGEATLSISMENGLSVRTEDPIGIRFRTYVNKAYVDANQDNIEIVVMITPTRNLDGKTFDADFGGDNDKIVKKIVFSNENGNLVDNGDYVVPGDETNYWYHACITGLQEQNIARDFSARSYVLYNGVLLENSYTDIAKGNAWDSAKAYLEDGTVSKTPEDIANAQALCAINEVTITGFENKTVTFDAKRGQTLLAAINENKTAIESALNVDGAAYFTGETDVKETDIVTEAMSVNAEMSALGFTKVDGGYAVSCSTLSADYTKNVKVPATYMGEPVIEVLGTDGFGDQKFESIVLPVSVTKVGAGAMNALQHLKTLVMPGVTDSANFEDTITSVALESVTTGAGFVIERAIFHNGQGTNKAKLFWASLPKINTPNSSGTAWADREYSNANYPKPIGVDVANCKLLSGEAYGWNGSSYVLLNAVVLGDTFIAPEDLNDGVNGAGKLTEVTPLIGSHVSNSNNQGGVTKAQNTLVNLVLPKSVTKIHEDAFINLRALKVLAMPGLTVATNYAKYSRIWSEVLEIVVLGEGFDFIGAGTNTWYNFTTRDYDAKNGNCYSKNITLFIDGDGSKKPEVKSSQDAFTYNTTNGAEGIYFYSQDPKANCWGYNKETGVPELHKISGTLYELNGEGTGYVLTAFAGDDKELTVGATYTGSAGELPVVAVGPNAFGANNTLETLILPKSVTLIDTNALSGLTALKTLVMPGITGSTHNSTTFKTTVTSTALETVTAGVGFIVESAAFHNKDGQNKAKLFWAELPNLDVKNSGGTSTLNKDYTSWLYPKAVAVNVANCKLLSGEAYGYKEGVGYVIMSYVGNNDTFIAPEVINDGVHGEGQIKEALPLLGSYVSGSNNQSGHTKRQTTLKNLILPESVEKVWENAFINYQALEVLAIPGLTTQQNYYKGSTISSTTLKVVVLGDGFEFIGALSYSNYNFAYQGNGNGGLCYSQNITLYINGSNAPVLKSSQDAFTYNTTNGAEGVYYFSENPERGKWGIFNGMPVLWDDVE